MRDDMLKTEVQFADFDRSFYAMTVTYASTAGRR